MYEKYVKRLIDIVLSAAGIVVLSPLLVPVMIILKITGEHDVFYFQERIGYRNKTFRIWKFATMLKKTPDMAGGAYSGNQEQWLLPLGGFLRKTKINELPQIVNILTGDMSIIGPRPLIGKTFDPYPAHVRAGIYNVKPGLTGVGSIIFRDEERLLKETKLDPKVFYASHISPYKGEVELWYQNHLSAYTDFMLVFLTAWVILSPKSELIYRVFKDLPARPEFLNNE